MAARPRPNSAEYGNSKTTTLLPSAKCTRPLFQGRTGCGGRPSGLHDIVTCQRLVISDTHVQKMQFVFTSRQHNSLRRPLLGRGKFAHLAKSDNIIIMSVAIFKCHLSTHDGFKGQVLQMEASITNSAFNSWMLAILLCIFHIKLNFKL